MSHRKRRLRQWIKNKKGKRKEGEGRPQRSPSFTADPLEPVFELSWDEFNGLQKRVQDATYALTVLAGECAVLEQTMSNLEALMSLVGELAWGQGMYGIGVRSSTMEVLQSDHARAHNQLQDKRASVAEANINLDMVVSIAEPIRVAGCFSVLGEVDRVNVSGGDVRSLKQFEADVCRENVLLIGGSELKTDDLKEEGVVLRTMAHHLENVVSSLPDEEHRRALVDAAQSWVSMLAGRTETMDFARSATLLSQPKPHELSVSRHVDMEGLDPICLNAFMSEEGLVVFAVAADRFKLFDGGTTLPLSSQCSTCGACVAAASTVVRVQCSSRGCDGTLEETDPVARAVVTVYVESTLTIPLDAGEKAIFTRNASMELESA